MKKAVVVGGSGGLGTEIISRLIKEGVKVVNVSRSESALKVENIKTDLTKNDEINDAIDIITKKYQDMDLLILCPGILHNHPDNKFPVNEIDEDFAINITGEMKITHSLLSLIKKNKGDIVIVGSTSSFVSYGNNSVYVAAKHAVLGFIKSLQVECKKEDVRVMGFHPGGFQSNFHIKAKSSLKQEDLMNPKYLADLILTILKLPRNMQVSEIIIDRKK